MVPSTGPLAPLTRVLWSQALPNRPRGLTLSREKGWLLAWDGNHWAYLFNQTGVRQAQRHVPEGIAAACSSDDGSAFAVVDKHCEVYWLMPDLASRWQRTVGQPGLAAALDPLGQYLAVADVRGQLHLFDRHGRLIFQLESPRPLHHLAFVPTAPFLIGCSNYGLVACFEMARGCVWRDGLVAHTGSLAVCGGGSILVACFSEGVQRYDLAGRNLGRLVVPELCRLAAPSYDGAHLLVAGRGKQLFLVDASGRLLASHITNQDVAAIGLAALSDWAAVALTDGQVICLEGISSSESSIR